MWSLLSRTRTTHIVVLVLVLGMTTFWCFSCGSFRSTAQRDLDIWTACSLSSATPLPSLPTPKSPMSVLDLPQSTGQRTWGIWVCFRKEHESSWNRIDYCRNRRLSTLDWRQLQCGVQVRRCYECAGGADAVSCHSLYHFVSITLFLLLCFYHFVSNTLFLSLCFHHFVSIAFFYHFVSITLFLSLLLCFSLSLFFLYHFITLCLSVSLSLQCQQANSSSCVCLWWASGGSFFSGAARRALCQRSRCTRRHTRTQGGHQWRGTRTTCRT